MFQLRKQRLLVLCVVASVFKENISAFSTVAFECGFQDIFNIMQYHIFRKLRLPNINFQSVDMVLGTSTLPLIYTFTQK